MQLGLRSSKRQTLAVLHPVFALTAVAHTVGGPLLPSVAAAFHFNDSQSGLLFFLYFAGTSLGALLCRANYVRTMTLGFVAMAVCCVGISVASWPILPVAFLFLGISVGVPMSAVSLFVGCTFQDRCAPLLTFLNFSWSVGALASPLIAARVLVHHSYRAAYVVLAVAALLAACACFLTLKDAPEPAQSAMQPQSAPHLHLIAVFALAAFLQVGVENVSTAWLSTYSLRMSGGGAVFAAVSSSLYWGGFLASRAFSSILLLRTPPARIFRIAIAGALAAAMLLAVAPSVMARGFAMALMGAALAPIYPLVIAGFFTQTRRTSDTRWILATAGFGGSVLPWLAGWISACTGSLRMGILTIPAALLLMGLVLRRIFLFGPAAVEGQAE